MSTEMTIDTSLSQGAQEAEGDDAFLVDIMGYEGPLHLLLELARKKKVDLMQVSMKDLAMQYLGFIERAKTQRIDLAADYLLMAAWLTFMKSRLLATPPKAAEEEGPSGEEMADRLAFRLQRLAAMRTAAKDLQDGPLLNNVVFLRGAPEQPKVIKHAEYTATLYDLTKAFGSIRERKHKQRPHTIERQLVLPLENARNTLRSLRARLDSWSTLDDIRTSMTDVDPDVPNRSVTASVFSAALELARDGEMDVRQDAHFEPLYLRRIESDAMEGTNATD